MSLPSSGKKADSASHLHRPSAFIKRLVAKIVGFDGANHRFTGNVTIEKFEKDVRVQIFDDHAIWKLMYFGNARLPTR